MNTTTHKVSIPREWEALARKAAAMEKVCVILKDIRRRAHDAHHPLEALEETINIEELAAQAIALIRGSRKGGVQ